MLGQLVSAKLDGLLLILLILMSALIKSSIESLSNLMRNTSSFNYL